MKTFLIEIHLTVLAYIATATFAVSQPMTDYTEREVVVLFNEMRPKGLQTVEWHGLDAAAQPVATGIYICQLQHQNGSTNYHKIIRF